MTKAQKESRKSAPTSSGGNPYLRGYSPTKTVKLETDVKPRSPHLYKLFQVRGKLYEVIILDHGKYIDDDGYHPYTVKAIQGNCTDKQGKPIQVPILHQMGISHVFYLRGPDGNALSNKSNKYNRRCLVKENTPEEVIAGRTEEEMKGTLGTVVKVTNELNKRIDSTSRIFNEYDIKVADPVLNPVDNELVSLDHFMPDKDVLFLLEKNCNPSDLNGTFAVTNPEAASVYFNPYRQSFPKEAEKYGFISHEPETNEEVDSGEKLIIM